MTKPIVPLIPLLPPELFEHLKNMLEQVSNVPTGSARAGALNGLIQRPENDSLDEQRLFCVLLYLRDLFAQGWEVSFDENRIPHLSHPTAPTDAVTKEWYRTALLHERDKQINSSPVERFIKSMEKERLYAGRKVSIKNLIAKPTDLLESLQEFGEQSIRPYLQVIHSKRDRDEFTGLKLSDIWRYFRLTWSLPYKSTPGRNIYFLIRDAARQDHPVVGISALGNSIVQITSRDNNIGWTLESLLKRIEDELHEGNAGDVLRSLTGNIDRALHEIEITDLIDGDLNQLDVEAAISLLLNIEGRQEESESVINLSDLDQVDWRELSRTSLYRRKRVRTLIELLRATTAFAKVADDPPLRALQALASTSEGRSAMSVALRANKKEKIGANMMDIIVCGAIPPYNYLLGGKLVSLLMMSPEIIRAYEEKYRNQISVIASGMKGQPVVRDSRLVFLGTTSLYETGSSQYNRVSIPARSLNDNYPSKKMSYHVYGLTKGYGTVYVSDETVEALGELMFRVHGARLVSNRFGEGTSPRFRLIRMGLELLGLTDEQLIRHNFKRIVYGVELARNTREFLRGEDESPEYFLDQEHPEGVTEAICEYWRSRWLSIRTTNPRVLEQIEQFSVEDFLLGRHFSQ